MEELLARDISPPECCCHPNWTVSNVGPWTGGSRQLSGAAIITAAQLRTADSWTATAVWRELTCLAISVVLALVDIARPRQYLKQVKMLEMNIDTLLQAAEYIERRERGKKTLLAKTATEHWSQHLLMQFSLMVMWMNMAELCNTLWLLLTCYFLFA